MQQPISALNGVIYSINESFLGPGCGSAGGMEGSNEDGKQPRMKEYEKQSCGGENVVYSGLSNRTKRRRSEESLSVDGVSVTIFTGNDQNDGNPLTFGSGGNKTTAISKWYAGENTVKEEVLSLVKRGISYSLVAFGVDVQSSFAMQSAPLIEWTGGSIVHVNDFFSQGNINAVGSADTIIEQVAEKVILGVFCPLCSTVDRHQPKIQSSAGQNAASARHLSLCK